MYEEKPFITVALSIHWVIYIISGECERVAAIDKVRVEVAMVALWSGADR